MRWWGKGAVVRSAGAVRQPRRQPRKTWRGARAVALGLGFATLAGAAAAQPYARYDVYTDRAGPYLLALAGGSQYEFDCRSVYYYYTDCDYGRAGAGKLGIGYSFGRIAVEGTWTDYGRARIDNGRTPRDTLQVQALGVNVAFSLPFGPASEGILRAGLADVRHSRSDDVAAQRVFTASVGLAIVLHLGPHAALEVSWDATAGEGRQTGSTVAGALLAGLRWSF